MEKEIVNQIQEAQRIPYRINPRRNRPRHILIKLPRTKHEERIRELEDKMLEITSKEQDKVKRMKRTEDSPENSGTISNAPTFKLQGFQKDMEKF